MSEKKQDLVVRKDEFNIVNIDKRVQIQTKTLTRIETHEFVQLFKKYPSEAIKLISRQYPLSEDLIDRYINCWDWYDLSINSNLTWSEQFIEKYIPYWNWNRLFLCEDIPWTEHLIDKHMERTTTSAGRTSIGDNASFPWSEDFMERYKHYIDWYGISYGESFSWSEKILDRFAERWYWEFLSENEAIPWTQTLIEKYSDRWNWEILSSTRSIPWTEELIEKYLDRWDWKRLSASVPWTEPLIGKYITRLDWNVLSYNSNLLWSEHLIDKFQKLWNWDGVVYCNPSKWTEDFFVKYDEKKLERFTNSRNFIDFPWTEDLVNKYADRLCLGNLSTNRKLPWSDAFIKKYANRWRWLALSVNPAITLSVYTLEQLLSRGALAAHSQKGGQLICKLSEPEILSIMDIVERNHRERGQFSQYFPPVRPSGKLPIKVIRMRNRFEELLEEQVSGKLLTIKMIRRFRDKAELDGHYKRKDPTAYQDLELQDPRSGALLNYDESFKYISSWSNQGNPFFQCVFGLMYLFGNGVLVVDYDEAEYWFRKALKKGLVIAKAYIGECYYARAVDNDLDEKLFEVAISWFESGANGGDPEGGDPWAQILLVECYDNGLDVGENLKFLEYWLKAPALQGDAGSQYRLGWHYNFASGVEKNYSAAIYWYREAAEQEYDLAQYHLGLLYLNGNGVEQSLEEANHWIQKSGIAQGSCQCEGCRQVQLFD